MHLEYNATSLLGLHRSVFHMPCDVQNMHACARAIHKYKVFSGEQKFTCCGTIPNPIPTPIYQHLIHKWKQYVHVYVRRLLKG